MTRRHNPEELVFNFQFTAVRKSNLKFHVIVLFHKLIFSQSRKFPLFMEPEFH